MPYLMIRHTVEDYDKWKPVFDEDAENRRSHGSQGGLLLRNADNPNEIVAFWEIDSLENAHQFVQTPELRERMQRAGVTSQPEITFMNLAERVSG